MKHSFPLGSPVRLEDVVAVAREGRKVTLAPRARSRVARSQRSLKVVLSKSQPTYGVNTGFGELASRRILPDQVLELQRNLVLSHASGVGNPLEEEEARAMMFLRANELARGFSGVSPELIRLMADCVNRGVVPWVPSQGSVGASGDLAPLAHAALLLIGEGYNITLQTGRAALARRGLRPLKLGPKEGLALINGTQAMQAVGGIALWQAAHILRAADVAGAASLEALKGTPAPFSRVLNLLKPHPGQLRVAGHLTRLLRDSEIRKSHLEGDPRVQDPYSLRCMPQVHGAVLDALDFCLKTLRREMNSVTDNPVLLKDGAFSGGNFHGQALSMAMDFAAVALACLGNISERRIFQLICGEGPSKPHSLPPFLASRPGLESGWMIAQVTAAALASENKGLAHPASADSIPTSANQEDFVSMGMGAALKLKRVVWNVSRIVAIELLAAAQGIRFHAPLRPGRGVQDALGRLAREAPVRTGDRSLTLEIEQTARQLREGAWTGAGGNL